MKITLQWLKLTNFMGHRHLVIQPSGSDTVIKGQNGSGKSTIGTAWAWLWTDKDMNGKADFTLKTIEAGETLHNLDHSVEADILVDGKQINLKKTLREKYTRKRGSATDTFTGHETEYYIDGLLVQLKEWNKFMESLFDPEAFRMVSILDYFNSDDFGKSLKPAKPAWKWRRDILFALNPNMPKDADIMSPELAGILNGKSYEDYQRKIKIDQSKMNEQIKGISPRIDELTKSIALTASLNKEEIQAKIKELEEKIQAIKDDNTAATLRKERAELETKLAEADRDLKKTLADREEGVNQEISDIQKNIDKLKKDIETAEDDIRQYTSKIKTLTFNIADLVKRWEKVDEKEYTPMSKLICSKCGANFNESQDEQARKDFNIQKSKDLEEIEKEGADCKNNKISYEEKIKQLTEQVKNYKSSMKEAEDTLAAARLKKEGLTADVTPEIKQAGDNLAVIRKDLDEVIAKIVSNTPPDTKPMEDQLRAERTKLAQIDAAEVSKKRIVELGEEQKTLSAEYEKLEYHNSLIEKFIVQKVSIIEDSVNDKFSLVKWCLFEKQINEGLKELATATIEGIPVGKGLNTGAEINGSIDIINTLSNHYNLHVPLFIDHSESVNRLFDIDTQVIKLQVTEDPQLVIEYKG